MQERKSIRNKKIEQMVGLYSAPAIEIHVSEPFQLLEGSTRKFTGTHKDGDDLGMFDENGNYINPNSEGAKILILGREFSFSDVWED